MTRKEQIKMKADKYCKDEWTHLGFVAGAEWADAHPNWISVEDELPPHNGRYIFYSDTMGVRTSYYYTDIQLLEHITHWMPLPEPPKKGGGQ